MRVDHLVERLDVETRRRARRIAGDRFARDAPEFPLEILDPDDGPFEWGVSGTPSAIATAASA